jgi:MFS family permease
MSPSLANAYRRNIYLFATLENIMAVSFISGNWIFFWLRLMTYGQLGLVDALSFGFGMLMEIPTGAIADMIGKKRTMMFAMFCSGLGFVIMGYAESLPVLIIGFWITQIGWAFYSGSGEALFYDSVKAIGEESSFDRLYSRISVSVITTLVVSSLIGGVMYQIDERLPHVAWGVTFLMGAVIAFWITEPPIANPQPFSMQAYFKQLLAGFKQLRQPALRPYLIPILSLRGFTHMFRFGLIQPAMAVGFGFLAGVQEIVMAVLYAGSGVGAWFLPKLREKTSDSNAIRISGAFLGFGFMSAFFPIGAWGFFGMLAIRIGDGLIFPLTSTILNREIPSEDRATTLSTVAFLTRIPYVALGIIAGVMTQNGQLGLFMLICGLVVLVTTLGWRLFRKPKLAQNEINS